MSFICHIHNYTEYNEEWNVFSAFNPSKCTHLEQWAADYAAPGEQSWTSCPSRDSNPQPWVTSGFKSNALSIRPTTEFVYIRLMAWFLINTKPQTNDSPNPQCSAQILAHSVENLNLNKLTHLGIKTVHTAAMAPKSFASSCSLINKKGSFAIYGPHAQPSI